MQVKHWEEYSEEEKKNLLCFWWRLSLNSFTLDTAYADEQFDYILEMDIDLVFATVVMLHVNRYGSGALFENIRNGQLCQLLNRTLEYRTAFSQNGRFKEMSDKVVEYLTREYGKVCQREVEGSLQDKPF